jgi:hypothetical protein
VLVPRAAFALAALPAGIICLCVPPAIGAFTALLRLFFAVTVHFASPQISASSGDDIQIM